MEEERRLSEKSKREEVRVKEEERDVDGVDRRLGWLILILYPKT